MLILSYALFFNKEIFYFNYMAWGGNLVLGSLEHWSSHKFSSQVEISEPMRVVERVVTKSCQYRQVSQGQMNHLDW